MIKLRPFRMLTTKEFLCLTIFVRLLCWISWFLENLMILWVEEWIQLGLNLCYWRDWKYLLMKWKISRLCSKLLWCLTFLLYLMPLSLIECFPNFLSRFRSNLHSNYSCFLWKERLLMWMIVIFQFKLCFFVLKLKNLSLFWKELMMNFSTLVNQSAELKVFWVSMESLLGVQLMKE